MSGSGASTGTLRSRVLVIAERRLPALTRLRALESLPIRLHRRRIYVLPSAFGVGFAILLGVMQLGALNYANNPAMLLTCLLAAAAWMSLFVGFRSLADLELVSVSASACHAGDLAQVSCRFATSPRARPNLRLRWNGIDSAFALAADTAGKHMVSLPTERRGWFRPGRLRLWTDQPLGLFVIWSWLNPDVAILVYPAAETSAPPFPKGSQGQAERASAADGDEFSGLRDYRSGDPQRRIAWKASARHESLLVRETERLVDDDLHFDHTALAGLDGEARIRRLTAWILAAEVARRSYTLELPDQRFGPGVGDSHRHACLRALALMPDAA
ncbi:MAG: DUF58 domain-containing protein [Xanthomonadales bacterium]|nr:DUF58 domain-containing protein [Xanthomonadales bacterium]